MKYKKITKKLLSLLLLIAGFLFFRLALAQDFGTEVVNTGLGGNLGVEGSDPRILISRIINIALGFLSVIAVLIVLYAGFLWMTSSGEEEKITRAKQILKSGLIGLLIILSSWAIAIFVITKLGGAIGGTGNGNIGGQSYCLEGESRSCGCEGVMVCANGIWGPCLGSNWDNCENIPFSCDGSLLYWLSAS